MSTARVLLLWVGVCALVALATASSVAPTSSGASEYRHLQSHALVSSHYATNFAWNGSDPAIQAYIRARYGSSSNVDYVRKSIPRWGRPSEISSDSEYIKEIAFTVAPGAAFFIVTLLIWIVWGCAACCCGKPNEGGYTKNQIVVPMATGVIFSLVVIAFCVAGLVYTERFDQELSGEQGLGQGTLNVLTHVDGFFSHMEGNLNNVSHQVTTFSGDLKTRLDSFTVPQVTQFLGNMSQFGVDTGRVDPTKVYSADPFQPTNYTDYRCIACSALGQTIAQLANDIDSQTRGPLAQIDTAKTNAKTQISDVVGQIHTAIGDASGQVGQIRTKATSYNSDVDDYKKKADDYESKRRAVVIVIFVVPIALSLFFWLAIWRKSEFTVKVLIHFMFFFGCFLWLMFAIHLPFSLLAADGCHYLDEKDPDLGSITTLSTDITGPVTACLAKRSLIDALSVADQLSFTDANMTFPVIPDVNGLFKQSDFSAVTDQISALTLQTSFPTYDPQAKYTSLANLNAQTNVAPWYEYYTLANVTQQKPADGVTGADPVKTRQYKYEVLTLVKTEAQLQAQVDGIHANMTRVNSSFALVVDQVNTLVYTDVEGLKGIVYPLIDAARAIKSQAMCDPLDTDYQSMKATFCNDMIVSISGLAMCSFFAGIFLFGVNFSGWFLIYRMQHGPDSTKAIHDQSMYNVGNPGVQMGQQSVVVSPLSMSPSHPMSPSHQFSPAAAGNPQSPNSQTYIQQGVVVNSEGATLAEMVGQPSAPQEF